MPRPAVPDATPIAAPPVPPPPPPAAVPAPPSGGVVTRRRRSAPLPAAAALPALPAALARPRPAGPRRPLPPPAERPRPQREPLPLRDIAPTGSPAPGAPLPALAAPASDEPLPARAGRPGLTVVQTALALLSWGALAGILYATSPVQPASRAAFFVALFCALFFTLAPLLQAVALRLSNSRVYAQAARAHATRQALLLAGFVVLNALLQLGRAWSELNALLLFGTFAVIEVVALSRR